MDDILNLKIEKVSGFMYRNKLYQSKTKLLQDVKEDAFWRLFGNLSGLDMCKKMSKLTTDEYHKFMQIITMTEDDLGGMIE